MLKLNVLNQTISRADEFNVVADSQNYLTAEFEFSEEWIAPVTAVFGYDRAYYNVLLEEGSCLVPWEVIKAPSFSVSVFCGDRITANKVVIPVSVSGYEAGENSRTPTPDVYTKLIALGEETAQLAQSVRDDADNGVFNGERGPKGEQGPQGEKGNTLFATFEIDAGTGQLVMTTPDEYEGVGFEINSEGYLEVYINE